MAVTTFGNNATRAFLTIYFRVLQYAMLRRSMAYAALIAVTAFVSITVSTRIGNGARFDTAFALLELLAFLLVGCLVLICMGRNRDLLEPIFFFLFLYSMYFFVKPLLVCYGDPVHIGYEPLLDQSQFKYTIIIAIVFLATFGLGYLNSYGTRALASVLPEFGHVKGKVYIIAFLSAAAIMAIIAYIYYFHSRLGGISNAVYGVMVDVIPEKRFALSSVLQGESSYVSQMVNFGKSLLAPTLFLAHTYMFNKHTRVIQSALMRFLFILYLAVAIALSACTGLRGSVVLLILGLIILNYYYSARGGRRLLKAILPITMVILIVYGMSYLRSLEYFHEAKKGPMNILVESITQRGNFEALWGITSVIPNRVPYYRGTTYLDMLFIRFIPRSLWRNKPVIYGADRVSEDLIGSFSLYSHSSVPMPAELYANFGLLGVLIGGFLWGILFKGVYVYFRRASSELATAVYVCFYISIMPLIEFATTYLVNWTIGIAFFYILSRAVARKGKNTVLVKYAPN